MSGDWYGINQNQYYSSDWASLAPAVQSLLVGFFAIMAIVLIALLILQIVGMAKAFKKAKQRSWAAIVPFYNLFTIVKISGLELWWFVILAILPFLTSYTGTAGTMSSDGFVASVSVSSFSVALALLAMQGFFNYKVAQSFGKGVGFAIGLTLLPPVFWMILGYSTDIKYKGPAGPYQINYPKKA